jgi:hypothetical protein
MHFVKIATSIITVGLVLLSDTDTVIQISKKKGIIIVSIV